MNPVKNPKVSVCVVSYNQKDYISECLDSLVRQDPGFPFEIVISDDASTDGTAEIIQQYADKYQDVIRPILHKRNIGAFKNFEFVHSQACGEYIAHIDGDDYALPGKIKKQADALDSDPECSIVFHRVIEIDASTSLQHIREPLSVCAENAVYRRSDLIGLGAIAVNSSKMYRSSSTQPPSGAELIDQAVQAFQVGEGYARFCCCEPLGVYRKGIGISATQKAIIAKKHYAGLLLVLEHFPNQGAAVCANALFELIAGARKKYFHLEMLKLFIKNFKFSFIPIFIKKIKFEFEFINAKNISGRK